MSDASNTSSPHQLDRMPPRNSTPPNSVNRNHPLTLKQLLEAHRERNVPQLYEGDIQESFVRGEHPGPKFVKFSLNHPSFTKAAVLEARPSIKLVPM